MTVAKRRQRASRVLTGLWTTVMAARINFLIHGTVFSSDAVP